MSTSIRRQTMQHLRTLRDRRAELDTDFARSIATARANGLSWYDIAMALGARWEATVRLYWQRRGIR